MDPASMYVGRRRFLGVLGDAQPEPYLRGSVAFLQEKDYISLAFSTALGVCRE